MDIYRFFNSKDVAGHLRNIGYELSAPEAAFVVYHSCNATLSEKMNAWIEIAETMPDCSMGERFNMLSIPSFKQFLHEYVGLTKRDLEAFAKPDGCVFGCSCNDKEFGWQDDGHLFSSLDACLGYLKESWADDDDPDVIGFRLAKSKLDCPSASRDDWLYLNRNLEVLDIDCVEEDNSDLDLKLQFDGMWFALPTPLHRGDVVIDARRVGSRPFVLSSLPTWGKLELLENGFKEDEDIVMRADRTKERMMRNADSSDMCCVGYGMGEGRCSRGPSVWSDAVLHAECMCGCYLDLERFDGVLEGSELWMEMVSAHLKGEVGFVEASNLLRYLAVESEARQLRGIYDSCYPEEHCPDSVWKRIRRRGRELDYRGAD